MTAAAYRAAAPALPICPACKVDHADWCPACGACPCTPCECERGDYYTEQGELFSGWYSPARRSAVVVPAGQDEEIDDVAF